MKRFVAVPTKVRKRANKGHSRVFSQCSMSRMKHEVVNNPNLISGELFRSPGEATVFRSYRYQILKKVETPVRPVTKVHIQMHLK